MSSLTLKQINKFYGKTQVLHDISFSCPKNSFIVLVGPSGCGKSTLLRAIAGLEDIQAGQIEIDGQDVTQQAPVDRNIAMVFQSYALYPQMSVAQNIAFPLKVAGESKAEVEKRTKEVAALLQIEPLLERKPKDLSGGQRQRVAIGRAIVRNPKIFLFDEPLSNLDAELRVEMRLQIAKLRNQLDASFVYVTHDQVEAMTLADTIVVLRAGIIEQIGSPSEIYRKPNNIFVAGFIGAPKMNFLPLCSKQQSGLQVDFDSQQGCLPLALHASALAEAKTLGIRPDDLKLAAQGQFSAHVEFIENLGHLRYLHARASNGQYIIASLHEDQNPQLGEQVNFAFDSTRALFFDANQQRIDW